MNSSKKVRSERCASGMIACSRFLHLAAHDGAEREDQQHDEERRDERLGLVSGDRLAAERLPEAVACSPRGRGTSRSSS